ncbi:MAG: hypothetical protein J6K16_03120 [Alphaproteobacteria bacterium]|nr:hypothetical protein [Alphaproteobacteria bacterium]
MKKFLIFTIFALLYTNANAQISSTPSYIEEMKALGNVSGTGMACGASKFATFEMLARAILITKAASDKNQEEGMIAYNTAKADAFLAKQADGMYNCDELNARFNNQKIFKTKLYADGTIKMYDGKVFYPRHPYDATLLKDDENLNRYNAVNIYKEAKNRNKGNKKLATSEDGQDLDTKEVRKPNPTNAQPLQSSAVRASEFRKSDDDGIGHISNKRR